MTFQTTKNDLADRSEKSHFPLENELRSIWLGEESLVQTFDEDLKCNVEEVKTLLSSKERFEYLHHSRTRIPKEQLGNHTVLDRGRLKSADRLSLLTKPSDLLFQPKKHFGIFC